MLRKTIRFVAIISAIAAIITISVFITGKSSIFEYTKSKIITKRDVRSNNDLGGRLKKYAVQSILVYEPRISIQRQLDENLSETTKDKIKKAIKTTENSSNLLGGMLIDELFIKSKSDYIQSLNIVSIEKPHIDLLQSTKETAEYNVDALCITNITLVIIGNRTLNNSALEIIGSIIGVDAENINMTAYVDVSIYHVETSALIYKETQTLEIIKDNKRQ